MKTESFPFAAAAAVALAAATASAGLRAWEPTDYVRDSSLAWHLDGIRNAGLGVAHSADTKTWADLSGNARDATRGESGTANYWTNDGFKFTAGAMDTEKTFSLGSKYTVEFLTDFKKSEQTGTGFLLHMRATGKETNNGSISYHTGQGKLMFRTHGLTGGDWLDGALGDDSLTYFTAFRNDSVIALVKDAKLPESWKGGSKNDVAAADKWRIGANTAGGGDSPIKVTVKSIRAYSRLLTDAELAWNRAIDDARFFGASVVAAAPVATAAIPDAFVATAVSGAEGAEASGAYVVDDAGYTFSAPATRTVSGTTYALTGCTVAAWDAAAGSYGAPVQRDGVFAVAVAAGDKVKITWQWTASAGTLVGGGYVADGLALQYDGIWNAGIGVHDSSATTWADISGTGNNGIVTAGDGATWTDVGFHLAQTSSIKTSRAVTLGTSHTIELMTDFTRSGHSGSDWGYFMASLLSNPYGSDDTFAIYYKVGDKTILFRGDKLFGTTYNTLPGIREESVSYLTALRDGAATALITGTTYPTTTNSVSGVNCYGDWYVSSSEMNVAPSDRIWVFGAAGSSATANYLAADFKSIRIYSRLLSEEELAHNRAADEFRFGGSGIPPATGAVVVQSSVAGLEGREPSGLYGPDAWTFAAGTGRKTALGVEWECAGYQLQTWDAASGTWGVQQTVLRDGGNAVEWTSPSSGTAFASVRLTWLWEPVSGVLSAADYAALDVSGYAAADALAWHLDGIRNVGAAAAHDASATTWADLSGHGRDAALAGNGDGTSAWTDDGFYFNKNAVFNTTATFHLGKSYTVSALVDVKQTDHVDGVNGHILSNRGSANAEQSGFIYYQANGKAIRSRVNNIMGIEWANEPGVVVPNGGSVSYLTMLRDDARAAIVAGAAYPTTSGTIGGSSGNTVCTDWSVGTKSEVAAADIWRIGANSGGAGNNPLKGTIKSVRAYDRLLSEGELAWNREIDSARYFGALATTNVVVEASDFNGDIAPGAYRVYGTATFAAAAAQDGSHANQVRVQTLQPDGTWGGTEFVDGTTYAYDPSAGTVKLLFRQTHPFVIVLK